MPQPDNLVTSLSFSDWTAAGRPWGKARTVNGELVAWLPLEQHCLDVALVFRALVDIPVFRRALGKAPLDSKQLDRLAVFALFHDLGKANAGFQSKLFVDSPFVLRGHTEIELVQLLRTRDNRFREFVVTPLYAWFGAPEDAQALLMAAWSHHGRPVELDQNTNADSTGIWERQGALDPIGCLVQLMDVARQAFPGAFEADTPAMPNDVRLQHQFAGLAMLADWLGSHAGYFPLTGEKMSTGERMSLSSQAARRIIGDVGLDATPYRDAYSHRDFVSTFGQRPRPLQEAIEAMPQDYTDLTVIAESDTGSGKTEAALYRYLSLYAQGKVDGLYFALPTRVAARELYKRVHTLIQRVFPSDRQPLTLLAVPGYVQADGVPALPSPTTRWADDHRVAMADRNWASELPKRYLAGPVVVGTIDQALLSIVQAPHAHMRSVCLDRHFLVVDEVHSSDEYMRALLQDLLRHRESVGAHSMLLSATLSNEARTELLTNKKTALPIAAAINQSYPAITGKSGAVPVPSAPSSQKQVVVTPTPLLFALEAVAREIAAAVQKGARVLAVMNTVSRAVSLQKEVEKRLGTGHPALFRVNGTPCPHHGRFSPADREIMDAQVTAFVGKGCQPGGRVVIGTQTLEQSLDIDADLLVTDLCPSDVLLQRIGREHRHERDDRPAEYGVARCILLVPPGTSLVDYLDSKGRGTAALSGTGLGSVYEIGISELSWRYFQKQPCIQIPADNRRIIEETMHSNALASLSDPRWLASTSQTLGGNRYARNAAAHCSIKSRRQNAFGSDRELFDMNIAALTRLGAGSAILRLQPSATSPFGVSVSSIVLPVRWGLSAPEAPVAVVIEDGRWTLELQGKRVTYSRFGLEKW